MRSESVSSGYTFFYLGLRRGSLYSICLVESHVCLEYEGFVNCVNGGNLKQLAQYSARIIKKL